MSTAAAAAAGLLMLVAPAGADVQAPATPATIVVSLDGSPPDPGCPATAGQFAAARAERDHAWLARQRGAGWTTTAVREVIRAAAADAAGQLGAVPARICVQIAAEPRAPILARMRGIAASASPATATVSVLVAPTLATPAWRGDLAFAVAHEYHHLVAARGGATGLDVLIREGLAHHFAWTRRPDRLHPSADAVAEGDAERRAWAVLRTALDLDGSTFTTRFMFGGPYYGDEVPTWTGYTIGFRLVQSYAARRPRMSVRDLMHLPSGDVLAGSRFGG